MIILLHTSKTMRAPDLGNILLSEPSLLNKATQLATYLKTLTPVQLAKVMHISPTLAEKTHKTYSDWSADWKHQSLAIDSFMGDIYSGLQASELSRSDRDYANEHLRILSGLYGILRPYDGICPYRLEMGYKLPDNPYGNLYDFWGDSVAKCLPVDGFIMNLAAVEYIRTITPFVDASRVVSPKFLTIDPETNEPTFVVVHAKIARGAFAHWLIVNRIQTIDKLPEFSKIGYQFDPALSKTNEPVFVCKDFGGKGLSMRLQG